MCHFSFLISLETRNISSVVGQGTNYLQQIHNTRHTEYRDTELQLYCYCCCSIRYFLSIVTVALGVLVVS